jgi:hypothetical protein
MFQRNILPSSSESKRRFNLEPVADGILLGLLSDPEDGGDVFL